MLSYSIEFIWIHILALNVKSQISLLQRKYNKQRSLLACSWERIIYFRWRIIFVSTVLWKGSHARCWTLHILVIWAISFKAHKTLLGKAWESNYSAQTLDLQKGGHFNKGGFFCCLWWFLFLSLFTHLLVFYDIFVFFFFFLCQKILSRAKGRVGRLPGTVFVQVS